MEGGKKPSSSIADELFAFGKDRTTAPNQSSSSSPGYFSSVFPPPSAVMHKDSAQSDLYWTLSKKRGDGHGQIGNAQGAAPDGKSQGSPTKRQTARNKDGKPAYPNQSEESAYFGSSVHYGGRDFYDSSGSNKISGAPEIYKDDKGEDSSDANVANRGEWWQGSLYY